MLRALYDTRSKHRGDAFDDDDKPTERYKDAIVAQAVNVPVLDSLAAWRVCDDAKIQDQDGLLGTKDVLIEAGIKSRLYGKSLVLPVLVGVGKGAYENKPIPFSIPLDKVETSFRVARIIHTVKFENSDDMDTDVLSEYFGLPKSYTLTDSTATIHPSRASVIESTRSGAAWLDTIETYIRDLDERREELSLAVAENNFIVLKTDMKMLNEMAQEQSVVRGVDVHNLESTAYELLETRLRDLRQNANSHNAYGIDKDGEEVAVMLRTNIDQIINAVNNAAELLSSAVDIPASRFLGHRTSSTLGGDDDTEIYAQTLSGLRDFMFLNALRLIDKLIGKSIGSDKLGFKWNDFIFLPSNANGTVTNETGGK